MPLISFLIFLFHFIKIGKLREDVRRKDADLIQERNLKAAVERRSIEIGQTLDSTKTTLETSNRECARLQEQVQRLNSELREEKSCRDWTIPCDEIVISENELGRGSWGWVKEGTFRGTKVAVKQMHEIIVSPHNRRSLSQNSWTLIFALCLVCSRSSLGKF